MTVEQLRELLRHVPQDHVAFIPKHGAVKSLTIEAAEEEGDDDIVYLEYE
jgi:hypothetical protein